MAARGAVPLSYPSGNGQKRTFKDPRLTCAARHWRRDRDSIHHLKTPSNLPAGQILLEASSLQRSSLKRLRPKVCVVLHDQIVNSPPELIKITSAFRSLTVVDCNEVSTREWCDIRRFIGAPGEQPPKRRSVAEIKEDGRMTT